MCITLYLGLQTFCDERYFGRVQLGRTHVHRDATGAGNFRGNHARQRLHANHTFIGQALVMHITGKAARAVAALLYL